jgi:hypothetical protein
VFIFFFACLFQKPEDRPCADEVLRNELISKIDLQTEMEMEIILPLKNKTKRLIKENEVLKNENTELKRRNTEQESILINSRKGYFLLLIIFYLFVILILFLLFLGKLVNAKDVDEKEAILKNLKNIAVDTKEQCIGILNSFTMNTKILCFLLPLVNSSDISVWKKLVLF